MTEFVLRIEASAPLQALLERLATALENMQTREVLLGAPALRYPDTLPPAEPEWKQDAEPAVREAVEARAPSTLAAQMDGAAGLELHDGVDPELLSAAAEVPVAAKERPAWAKPPGPDGIDAITADRDTIKHWGFPRGIYWSERRADWDAFLASINAKRTELGLPPFALPESGRVLA